MKTDGNSPPTLENAIPAHPSVSVESDDSPVLISINGLGNVTDTSIKTYSDLQKDNYSDIPLILDLAHTTYCGYNATTNYSAVADVALHDPRI